MKRLKFSSASSWRVEVLCAASKPPCGVFSHSCWVLVIGGFGSYAGLGSALVDSSIAGAGELLEPEGNSLRACSEKKLLLAR